MQLPRTLTLPIKPCIKPLVLSATLMLPAALLVAPRLGEASYTLLAVSQKRMYLNAGGCQCLFDQVTDFPDGSMAT